jgi:hypothetical protein
MFFRRKKDNANDEITRLLKQQELVRLSSENVKDLASIIENSYKGCPLIPIKLYPSSDGKSYSAFVGDVTYISYQLDKDVLDINVPSTTNLRTTLFYGLKDVLFFYSDIPSPDDAHTHCGLYLKRQGENVDSESLLLKPPFCEKNLPNVYRKFQQANDYKKSVRDYWERLSTPRVDVEQSNNREDYFEIPLMVPSWLLPFPLMWMSSKGVSVLFPKEYWTKKNE